MIVALSAKRCSEVVSFQLQLCKFYSRGVVILTGWALF